MFHRRTALIANYAVHAPENEKTLQDTARPVPYTSHFQNSEHTQQIRSDDKKKYVHITQSQSASTLFRKSVIPQKSHTILRSVRARQDYNRDK